MNSAFSPRFVHFRPTLRQPTSSHLFLQSRHSFKLRSFSQTVEVKPPNFERKLEVKVEQPSSKGQSNAEQDTKELKRTISSKPPRLMKLWAVLGALGFIGAVVYYLNEEDQQERKISGVIRLLGNPDIETRKLALKALDECLYESKVLMFTVADIPQPKSNLVQRGAIEALYDAFGDGDEEVREGCLVWLLRLASEEEGRKRILRSGIAPLLGSLGPVSGNSRLWINGTALLLELSKHEDSVGGLADPAAIKFIKQLKDSSVPVAQLAAGSLYFALSRSSVKAAVADVEFPPNSLDAVINHPSVVALKAAVSSVIPREPISSNPALSPESTSEVLLRAGAFGFIGSVYGRIRWWLHARRQGLKGKELTKFVNKRSKTGRYVFTLMAMDIAAQALMLWPKEGIIIPLISDKPIHIPESDAMLPTTAIPVGEAGLVVLMSLWAIRYQRYVVLPMLMASWNAHWETVDKYTKPYQELLGIDVNKMSSYIYGQVKVGVESAAEVTKEAVKEAVTGKKDK